MYLILCEEDGEHARARDGEFLKRDETTDDDEATTDVDEATRAWTRRRRRRRRRVVRVGSRRVGLRTVRVATMAVATDAVVQRFGDEGFGVESDVVAVALADVARDRKWSADELAKMWNLFDANALSGEELEMRHVVRIEWIEKFEAFAREESTRRANASSSSTKRMFGGKKRVRARGLSLGSASEGGVTPGKSPRTPGSASAGGRATFASATPTKTKREWSEALDALTGDEPSEYSKRAATPGSASATGGDGVGNVSLNAHLSAELAAAEDDGECAVETTPGVVAREKFRYMRDTIPDRVRAINARIRDVETRFRVADEDEDENETKRAVDARTTTRTTTEDDDAPRVSRVGSTTGAEDAHFIGRIVSAVHDSDAKLTEKTVALEGSIEQSCGDRVRLELRDLERYSLFPGQVVRVTGRNPAGHCLVVKSIDTAPAVKPFARSPRSSPAFTRGAKVLVASGPFSCSSDLRYEPLGDFLEYARDENPDVVVLCGPIVDAENVFVKKGDCNGLTFHEVAALTAAKIEARLPEKTKVIYVPSVRDATLDAAFPQPAPVVPGDARRAFSVSNPGTFTVNGVVFSVCTHDAVKHLSAHEISKGFVAKDRLTRLAGHFARQAHAYPLYPPDASACMDARHADALRLDVAPDVFILPSDLKTFCEDVDGVVCVNPGRLARGGGGGTLAKIVIHPAATTTEERVGDESSAEHRVSERARVDVMKIK